jgi:hypothetical protein
VDWIAALVPVLSFAAGAAAQLGGEALRDRRRTAREESAAARARAREDERAARDFERETLLALQDAVQRYARLVGRAHHAAHKHIRGAGGSPRTLVLPDDVDAGLLSATAEVDRLQSRVASAEVAGWMSRMRKDALEATMIGIGASVDGRAQVALCPHGEAGPGRSCV